MTEVPPEEQADAGDAESNASGVDPGDPGGAEFHCLSIDEMVLDIDWSPHLAQLGRWRQGHLVVDVPAMWVAPVGPDPFTGYEVDAATGQAMFDPTGRTWIITSQTCDLGGTAPGDRHPFIHLAPLVHSSVLDKNRVRLAIERKAGDLIPVLSPFGGTTPKPEWFADLRLQVPVSKAILLTRDPIEGFSAEDQYLEFGTTLGYKVSRPALDAALSEEVPRILDQYVKDNGARKQCFAKVEQVRILITPQRLEPAAVTFYILTNGVGLTPDEREVWDRFQAKVSTALKDSGVVVSASVHCDVSEISALVYRTAVPVYCEQLNALRFL